ncbi:nucleotidyltransferase [Halobacillus litoralis]|uniref:nucleotidyltransferase n=1 Tax=Halobacillus litoralis TaxID=45668 RepID=UPI001CD34D51|nr:nucleotidyltransferase [Halobacillus litoralis]MCA0970796.1 nucleotidyltransferase [Halobacillus litoralis]
MTEIKEIGSLCTLDDHGYIINESDSGKINARFQEAIQLLTDRCLAALPNDIHSLYLRGSVPKGLDMEGVSDVDFIAVTYKDPEELDLDWVEETEQFIDQKFSFINGVDLGFSPISEVEETEHCSMIPFILKTYGLCVYGENLIPQLPDYKPDVSLANEHLIHFSSLMDYAKGEVTDNDDVEDIKDVCSWIMRIIVRAGGVLVIDQEKAYTRDLFPAYTLFAKHYPEKEQEMKTALWYSINPLSDSGDILEFLNGFGQWMEAETEKWLDVHNPKRAMHLPL